MRIDQYPQITEEFNQFKEQWEKNIELISERQLSQKDIVRIYNTFDAVTMNFGGRYGDSIIGETLQIDATVIKLRTDLNLAVQKGKQNYRNEMHRQRMETVQTWGEFLNNIKFNIVSFLFGIGTAIAFLFFRH